MFCYVVERRVWVGTLAFMSVVIILWGGYLWSRDGEFGSLLGREREVIAERDASPLAPRAERGEGYAEEETTAVQPVLSPTIRVSADDGHGAGEVAVADAEPDFDARPLSQIYDEFRLERDRLQARRIEAVERAMEDPDVAETKRWESHQLMLDMLTSREREIELEYMLRAQGYDDAVVAVRDQYANVVVDGLLEQHEAARIGELVVRVAGIPLERIAIVDGYQGP